MRRSGSGWTSARALISGRAPAAGRPDRHRAGRYRSRGGCGDRQSGTRHLFDGNHTGDQLFDGTPATLGELLTRDGLALLRHPAGGLAAALRIADSVCDGWTPAAPTRLYLAINDEQAVNANTWHCQAGFAARHARVPVINLGTPDNQGSRHYGSNVAGTAQIVRWFLRLSR
jgi:hypothetical protein